MKNILVLVLSKGEETIKAQVLIVENEEVVQNICIEYPLNATKDEIYNVLLDNGHDHTLEVRLIGGRPRRKKK